MSDSDADVTARAQFVVTLMMAHQGHNVSMASRDGAVTWFCEDCDEGGATGNPSRVAAAFDAMTAAEPAKPEEGANG